MASGCLCAQAGDLVSYQSKRKLTLDRVVEINP